MRVAQIDGPARREGEQVAAGIRARERAKVSFVVKRKAVDDGESAAVERVSGHEAFGKVIQTCSVYHHAWFSDRVDERSSRRVAHDVSFGAFRAVHEGLPDAAVHDQFSAFCYLAKLVLRVAVDAYFESVHTGAEIVADIAVAVYANPSGVRPQPDSVEPLSGGVEDNEFTPAKPEGVDNNF